MKLTLIRRPSTQHSTIGTLAVDGVFECFTLEDVVREKKIHGETAIPAGIYAVDISYSPHFKRDLPILLNVPNYEGVRIHPGNTDADTEGCILVGRGTGPDRLTESRLAFATLFDKLDRAEEAGDAVTIEITQL